MWVSFFLGNFFNENLNLKNPFINTKTACAHCCSFKMWWLLLTVFCSSLFEVMVEIELPKNLACKHTKNLLNVIYYRCLWRNQWNSVQISDTLCICMVLIYIQNMVNFDLKYGIVRYYLYVTCCIQYMDLEESMLWNTFYIWLG